MNTYAVDWGGHADKLVVHDGQETFAAGTDLLTFVRERSPCRILIEPTFESYARSVHNQVIDEAERLGTSILTLPTRKTASERGRRGIEKSDEADAKLIWTLYHEGRVHFAHARRWAVEENQTRMERIELLRRRGYPKEETQEFVLFWPSRHEVPARVLDALGDGKKDLAEGTLLPLIAASLDVLESGGTRDDFDRFCGTYGHGYPSFVRSNLYWHRLQALRLRRLKESNSDKSLTKSALKGLDDSIVRKQAMRDIRWATRWVFHHVKSRLSGTL